MQIIYQGPFNAVEVPDAGLVAVNGEPIEVSTELGKKLLEQESNWAKAPLSKSKKDSD